MDINVLGSLQVDGVELLEPRDVLVLGALVVLRGKVVAADRLVEPVWGQSPPASWPKQVQICVGRLRKVVGSGVIETVAGGYRLTVDAEAVDVDRFERLIERARVLVVTGELDRAVSSYSRALGLWRGRPMEELDHWAPARIEADRLEELRRTAEEDVLDARLAAGEHRQVAVDAEALAAHEPLRERRWAILALARYRCGRQADALAALAQARKTLRDELGIEPGRELVTLEDAILHQDVTLAAVIEPPPVSEECPYKGLAPYDVDDAEGFFGRDVEVAACLERLRSTPLLVVAGPSGCGKSSLVRAGLVPALHARKQPTVVFVPGNDPEAAMDDAVAAAGASGVLVVDQFEELFTLGCPADGIRGFCKRLVEYCQGRGAVVIAVRSDHLGGLSVDAGVSRLAEQGIYLVGPLEGDQLREAIEQPAVSAGLRVEHGLIDLLVRDSEGEPGALPLLSHALAETWRRRDGNTLTVEAYQATGGIRGAVARSADRLYDSLPSDQRTLLRSVLLRLVAPSPGGDPVRSRVSARSLLGDPGRERVVALLVRSRLVTAEEETFELAHEALARAWPRLQSWLDDDAAGQRVLRHLAAAAEGWETLGRPDTELYRGARLDTALEWHNTARPDLTEVEAAFLDASVAYAASESRVLAERARRDARHNRRLRVLLATTAILLIGSTVAAVMAVQGRQQAREQRDVARTAQDDAQLEALVNQSLALRSTNRSVAALLAVEAFQRQPDARAWSALLATFTAAPGFLGYHYLPADHVSGTLVPDTSTAVVAIDGHDLAILDLVTGDLDRTFPPADPETLWTSALAVSGDGRLVAQLVHTDHPRGCGTLEILQETDDRGCSAFFVYDVASGRRMVGPVTTPFGPADIAINGDGSLIATAGGFDGDLAVYRGADGVQIGTLDGLKRPEGVELVRDTAAVAFAPDGRLYLGSMAGPIRALDPSTLEVLTTFETPLLSSHNHLATTPQGVVVAGGSNAIAAIDPVTETVVWSADVRTGVHPEPCPWLTVAAVTGRVYCGNYFGVIEERDLTTGHRTGAVLDPQLGSVGELAVTTDGRELVAFGDEAPVVARWRLDGSGLAVRRVADGHVVYDGYDPSGSTMLMARRDQQATVDTDFTQFAIWDPVTDRPIGVIEDVVGLGWVGHDTLLGLSLASIRLEFYDAESRSPVDGVAISLDADHTWPSAGGTHAYVGLPGEVWPVDVATRQRIEPTIRIDGIPLAVSATRGGEQIVITTLGDEELVTTVYDGSSGEQLGGTLTGPHITSVSLDGVLVGATAGDIIRYDLDTLEPIATLPGARGEVNTLQFSHDGTVLLATSNDKTVSVYDLATGTRVGDPIPADAPLIYPGWLRPDGETVAITQAGGVAVWDIAPRRLAELACKLAGRNLTPTEWATYLEGLGDYQPTCPSFSP